MYYVTVPYKLLASWQTNFLANAYFYSVHVYIYMKLWNFQSQRKKLCLGNTSVVLERQNRISFVSGWNFTITVCGAPSRKHSVTRVTVSECVCAGGLIYRRKPHHTACIYTVQLLHVQALWTRPVGVSGGINDVAIISLCSDFFPIDSANHIKLK